MPQPLASYNDGLQSVTLLSVYCYNNAVTFLCYDGDPGEDAIVKEFTDSDMSPIGSDTHTGFRKGTLNLQYNLATDEAPTSANQMRPGFIVSFRSRYYVVGAVKPKIEKNNVIKFSVAVLELQNPFLAGLLSTAGQQKTANITANVASNINTTGTGQRTNAVLAYSVETFATPGSAAPSGVSINSNTGVLTVNVAASTVDVRVVVTDTLAGDVHYGWGRYTATAA